MSLKPSSPDALRSAVARLVVARMLDGRMIKGTTHDFHPNKPHFHIYENGDESEKATRVELDALKAVFYVKTFEGEKGYSEEYDFDKLRGHGRKVLLKFVDGEVLAGFTMGYNPNSQGFFVIPADPEANNTRVFIVHKAVDKLEWL